MVFPSRFYDVGALTVKKFLERLPSVNRVGGHIRGPARNKDVLWPSRRLFPSCNLRQVRVLSHKPSCDLNPTLWTALIQADHGTRVEALSREATHWRESAPVGQLAMADIEEAEQVATPASTAIQQAETMRCKFNM